MGLPWDAEWRLLHVALLNTAVLWAAARFVRGHFGGDLWARLPAIILIWLGTQYLSVGLPGIGGILSVWSISGVALVLSAGLWLSAPALRPAPPTKPSDTPLVAWFWTGLAGGCVGWLLWWQWPLPPLGDDVLTYHLPAAVTWLQTGTLGLLETWYFNPANTYSPLGGSFYIAWWMAPMGSDWLARFAQVPALALIFFTMIQLALRLGASPGGATKAIACRRSMRDRLRAATVRERWSAQEPLADGSLMPRLARATCDCPGVAAAVAIAATFCRPIIAQTVLAKDDLYLAGFFLAALLYLSSEKDDRRSALLGGMALGLMLATKVTALLSLPVLALAWRPGWSWRRYVAVIAGAALLAGPWYLRTAWLSGNPLYPTRLWGLPGLFSIQRSELLHSPGGIWEVISGGYLGIPLPLLGAVGAGWLMAWGLRPRDLARDPLVRACLIGPVVGLIVFAAVAPYAELRFIYPSVLVAFAALAAVLGGPGRPWTWTLVAGGVAALAVLTAFAITLAISMAAVGLCAAAATTTLAWRWQRQPATMAATLRYGTTPVLAGAFLWTYIHAQADLRQYAHDAPAAWRLTYGELAQAWQFVREQTPANATIAYANTYLTYPLYGAELERRVVYAPTRAGVRSLSDLPPLTGRYDERTLRPAVVAAMTADPDAGQWWRNLQRSGADYLLIAKAQAGTKPPELEMARSMPARLTRAFENDAAVIYSIKRMSPKLGMIAGQLSPGRKPLGQ